MSSEKILSHAILKLKEAQKKLIDIRLDLEDEFLRISNNNKQIPQLFSGDDKPKPLCKKVNKEQFAMRQESSDSESDSGSSLAEDENGNMQTLKIKLSASKRIKISDESEKLEDQKISQEKSILGKVEVLETRTRSQTKRSEMKKEYYSRLRKK